MVFTVIFFFHFWVCLDHLSLFFLMSLSKGLLYFFNLMFQTFNLYFSPHQFINIFFFISKSQQFFSFNKLLILVISIKFNLNAIWSLKWFNYWYKFPVLFWSFFQKLINDVFCVLYFLQISWPGAWPSSGLLKSWHKW